MKPEKKVGMTKRIADRWLRAVAFPEYRFKILIGSHDIRDISNLLYAFRDGKKAMQGAPRVVDLGLKVEGNSMELWSRDYTGLKSLSQWFEKRGFETTGIW